YVYNKRLAERISNQALMAAAQDNRSDAFVSIGAAVGIFGAQFGISWLDPLAALTVGFIICKTAWDIFREATHTLTDGFDEAQLDRLRKTVESTEGVRKIKEVKARLHGSLVLVDVVVQVDPKLSLIEGHHICDDIEQRMKRKHN
ncbi:cation diffusion facilitator family transporter, partial [Enterobacter quasiroggenkampii]|nr:cation diffusion facilitator family transporter [Enterobacter quasiroggenkampii]